MLLVRNEFRPLSNPFTTVGRQVTQFQPSVAFDIKTSHLICRANQMNGFYVICNNGMK